MTLEQLKGWVNSLPEELLQFYVVYGVESEVDEQYVYRIDAPIQSAFVDMDTEEIVLLSTIDEDDIPEDEKNDLLERMINRENEEEED